MRVRLWCLLAVVAPLSAAAFAQEQQPQQKEQEEQPTQAKPAEEQAQQPQPAQEPAPAPKPAEEQAAQPQPVELSGEQKPPDQAPAPAPRPEAQPGAKAVEQSAGRVKMLTLSPQEVDRAIKLGTAAKGKQRGLRLLDTGRGILNALSTESTLGSGFSLRVYTPIAWIEQQASDAAKEYRTILPDNLDENFSQAVLRVVVYPDTPTEVSRRGMVVTSSAQHVVLRDEKRKIVIQPLDKESFSEDVSNAMGGRATYDGVRVTFPLDDVAKVRGPNGMGEFFITVVGDRDEKDFKVKAKHFDELPGLASAAKK